MKQAQKDNDEQAYEVDRDDPAWGSPGADDGDGRHGSRRRFGRGRFGPGRGFGPGFGPRAAGRGNDPEDFPEDEDGREGFGDGRPGGRRGFGRFGQGPFGPGGFGPGGFGPGGFGPGGFGRGGWGPGGGGPGRGEGRGDRGGRRPRGNVRAAILALLAEEPAQGYHGYAIMGELTKRSGGLWRPSPGSVYPVLQQLQDEGLVRAEDAEGGRKVFSITDAGRESVQQNPSEYAEPWAMAGPGQRQRVQTLFEGMGALGQATQQVARLGSDEQVERARQALDEARRRIYLILAEDRSAEPAPEPGASDDTE
ncbi:PadR family transcriptional regulator [Kineosporia sp. NBRC 101731]|uniref:PadR family transcriptional regulator n=1 Tax=Kineosporia sp. NBRC 101731 TaxID=3032199 RepID=UPI0024A24321|nr:PadR family transcriptional regulator [Kineosporia sp. NBRC 101731]GLY33320.1 hypothetical protein Kisp02_66850 [Kineosporia sp. NBRC 101731]